MNSLRPLPILAAVLVGGAAVTLPAQEWLEDAAERLQFQRGDGAWRARVGVLLDLEAHYRDEPVADLLSSDEPLLFAPRLTLNFDAQAGARLYAFAQARADRGFDAADRRVEVRLDEYALRLKIAPHGALNLQAGKFATVVGNWVARHDARHNPFVSAPLPYENLTGLWDFKPPPTAAKLLEWGHVKPASPGATILVDRSFRLPLIWGPAYSHGVAVSGSWGRFSGAVEWKTDALTARPSQWRHASLDGRRPTIGTRVGWRPNEMWDLGLSYSEGEYLAPAAWPLLPAGVSRQAYRQRLWAQDVGFAWHRFQFWAEVFAAEFSIPRVAELRTFAYYLEARYKFSPGFSLAARWNEQRNRPIASSAGLPWSRDVWRLDLAPTWRLGARTHLKLQYSLQHERPAVKSLTSSWSAQFSLWL